MRWLAIKLARTLAHALIVMAAVSCIAFLIARYLGDPINSLSGPETSFEDRSALRHELGLDQSAPVQFVRFLGDAARGRFGVSLEFHRPAADLMAERLPATLELVSVALVLAIGVGVPLGVMTAVEADAARRSLDRRRQAGWLGRMLRALLVRMATGAVLIGVSLPSFVVGIGLIFIFSARLRLLPAFGRGEVVDVGPWPSGLLTASGWTSILMPALTLGVYQMASVARLISAELQHALKQPYILFARARGLSEYQVVCLEALPNAAAPVVAVLGAQLGNLIAFAVVTESVFQWPGVGFLFIEAVQSADVPLLCAYLMLASLVFVFLNFLADEVRYFLDPRVRSTGGMKS